MQGWSHSGDVRSGPVDDGVKAETSGEPRQSHAQPNAKNGDSRDQGRPNVRANQLQAGQTFGKN